MLGRECPMAVTIICRCLIPLMNFSALNTRMIRNTRNEDSTSKSAISEQKTIIKSNQFQPREK